MISNHRKGSVGISVPFKVDCIVQLCLDKTEYIFQVLFTTSLSAATLRTEGLTGVLSKLKGANAEQLAAIMPNVRAMASFAAAVKQADGMLADHQALLTSGGATLRAYTKMTDTLQFSLDRSAQAIKAGSRAWGGRFAPTVQAAANILTSVLSEQAEAMMEATEAGEQLSNRLGEGFKFTARTVALLVDSLQVVNVTFKSLTFAAQDFISFYARGMADLAKKTEDLFNKMNDSFIGRKLGAGRSRFAQGFEEWADAAEMATRQTGEAIAKIIEVPTNLELVNRAIDKLAAGTNNAADATEKLNEKFKKTPEVVTPINDAAAALATTADKMGDSFGRAFEQMAIGAGKASDAVRALASDIASILLRQKITGPLASAIGSFLTPQSLSQKVGTPQFQGAVNNWMSTDVMHGGGIAGAGGPSRIVPASVFDNASRFHNGLASDEIPAILQKGEAVIPKGGGPAAPQIVINNNSGVPLQSDGGNFDGEKFIVNIVAKNFDQGGILRQKFSQNG